MHLWFKYGPKKAGEANANVNGNGQLTSNSRIVGSASGRPEA